MKNFYKLNILAIMLCLIPMLSNASERMVDRSLSVEETFHEPIVRAPQPAGDTGFSPNITIDPNTAKQLQDLKAQNKDENLGKNVDIPPPPSRNLPFKTGGTQNYMNQFCASSGGEACKATQKQQACERFKAATVDVQQLLDRAIDCEVNAANAIEGDCDGLDAGRLDLMKQYWQDEDMSYTILFLPDMVLNASAACGKKGIAR
jgi:hypothetical protein